MPDFDNLIYEKPEAGIARIWLNRPESRNAQDTHLLYELNDAFDIAMGDSEVKVVILAAKGPHFSACLLYTSPSPRDGLLSRMPSSA